MFTCSRVSLGSVAKSGTAAGVPAMRTANRVLLFEKVTLSQLDQLIRKLASARDTMIRTGNATEWAWDENTGSYEKFTPVYEEVARLEDEVRAARNVESARRRI